MEEYDLSRHHILRPGMTEVKQGVQASFGPFTITPYLPTLAAIGGVIASRGHVLGWASLGVLVGYSLSGSV